MTPEQLKTLLALSVTFNVVCLCSWLIYYRNRTNWILRFCKQVDRNAGLQGKISLLTVEMEHVKNLYTHYRKKYEQEVSKRFN